LAGPARRVVGEEVPRQAPEAVERHVGEERDEGQHAQHQGEHPADREDRIPALSSSNEIFQ
jgi:hypothetical protein